MREIKASRITETVKRLCIEANCHLTQDLKTCIRHCRECEPWPQAQEILDRIIENYEIADEKAQPICQDTGVACVFLKVGQDVHIDGDVTEAVNDNVYKSARNLPRVSVLPVSDLNALEILKPKEVLLTKSAMEKFINPSAAE